ncbi:MAG: alanine racemase [Chloroflexi bacterium]|nr:alanine racemase [Chloroflexota bacterium]
MRPGSRRGSVTGVARGRRRAGRTVELNERIEDALRRAALPGLPRTAWLEIDLDRLAANLAAVRAAVPAGVRIEPVVKADAYGHGAVAVASWLERCGADGFCVATLDEGQLLRAAGIERPILVLYPIPPDGGPAAADLGLAVTVADEALLARLCDAMASPAAAGRPPLVLHVEVETGLGRGGVAVEAVARVVDRIGATPGITLGGLWSHLAAPEDAVSTTLAVRRFADASAGARGEAPPVARHLVATGALLAASAPLHERVRLGLGLYGLVPDGLEPAAGRLELATALAPVMSLHTRPVRVADLPAGHGVSYGPSFVTARPSRVATLPIGYGDGWPRVLSNRAAALVRGRRVPLVGTVAMDAVVADVTDVPGSPVTVDDEFVLLGRQGDAEIRAVELAHTRTTITWEVMAQMAGRLPRVYHAAAVPVGIRTLTEEVYQWQPGSSSGTGTSATSRSTRS